MTSTEKLVAQARSGDLEAFEELIVLYQERVFSHCIYLAGTYEDGQDLAQEVFVKAYRGIDSFRGQADFGTWLHRITTNTWINMQRSKKILTLSIDEPIDSEGEQIQREIAATDDNPLEVVEREEFNHLVQQALGKLPPEFSSVLVLREMEGYSYQEIAEILNCSLGTVKSRINRARRDIKSEVSKLFKKRGLTI